MKEKIREYIEKVARRFDINNDSYDVVYNDNLTQGDLSSNIALVNAKKTGLKANILAQKLVDELNKEKPDIIEKIESAPVGFINFFLKIDCIKSEIDRLLKNTKDDFSFGKEENKKENVIIEHTDPNTFKPFHIGHLMANAIGESLQRLISFSGNNVIKICYPSDIGLHIAKSIWAIKRNEKDIPKDSATIIEKTDFLGKMYAFGTAQYEKDENIKKEIDLLNKEIYKGKDKEIHDWYEKGKKWSLEHFQLLYERLGTKFDDCIYESETAPIGLQIVKDNKGKIFEESEGATIFRGDKYNVHTRVFVNSLGVPTYEAKDLGLNTEKFKRYPMTDKSIIVTANEQNDYFKVIIQVLSLLDANIGKRTHHIGHGMLRLPSGKMSSRTGKVITAEGLISNMKTLVLQKMEGNKEIREEERDQIADIVAIAAIKYTILRQAIGSDIIFDPNKSISFEGDSGPYLQYSAVRAKAILEKAKEESIPFSQNLENISENDNSSELLRILIRFSDIIKYSNDNMAPQHIANYLINLAGAFNSFYAKQRIVDKENRLSSDYVTITKAFLMAIKTGLCLLGIKVPEKM